MLSELQVGRLARALVTQHCVECVSLGSLSGVAMCEWLHVWKWPGRPAGNPPVVNYDGRWDWSSAARAPFPGPRSPHTRPEPTMVSHQGQTTCYVSGAVQIPQRPKNSVQMAREESANCSPAVGMLRTSAFKLIQHVILHIHWFLQVPTILRHPLLNQGVHLGVRLRWLFEGADIFTPL